MKRFSLIVLSFILCLSVVAFTSCASQESTKSVTVEITDTVNNTAVSGELSLPDNCTAGEHFRQLCNQNDIAVQGVDEGYITSVGDVKTEGNYAWMFYINGELSEGGISDYNPQDTDTISLTYLDWTQISFE